MLCAAFKHSNWLATPDFDAEVEWNQDAHEHPGCLPNGAKTIGVSANIAEFVTNWYHINRYWYRLIHAISVRALRSICFTVLWVLICERRKLISYSASLSMQKTSSIFSIGWWTLSVRFDDCVGHFWRRYNRKRYRVAFAASFTYLLNHYWAQTKPSEWVIWNPGRQSHPSASPPWPSPSELANSALWWHGLSRLQHARIDWPIYPPNRRHATSKHRFRIAKHRSIEQVCRVRSHWRFSHTQSINSDEGFIV